MRNWFRYGPFARAVVGSLVVLSILLAVAYFACCTQAGKLAGAADGDKVVMAGQVVECFGDVGENCVYVLEDPSGSVYVTSDSGTPAPGTFVVVWGSTRETDAGRAMLVEHKRAGTF